MSKAKCENRVSSVNETNAINLLKRPEIWPADQW